MLAHALALLCVLSAVTFTAFANPLRWVSVALVSGTAFIIGALWLEPHPAVVGVIVVVAVGSLLRWPRLEVPAVAVSGLMAGLWSALLSSQGLPIVAAWILASIAVYRGHRRLTQEAEAHASG